MAHYIFPGDFVFWTSVAEHEEIKKDLLPKVEARYPLTEKADHKWRCEVNTEFTMQDFDKYVPLVTRAIYPAVDKMFQEMPTLLKPTSSNIEQIWYNHYNCGYNQEVHTHINLGRSTTVLSGVYFLELNEPNTTVFFSYDATFNPFSEHILPTTEIIKEGDIVLFPSKLLHYVTPSKESRTTIAFNITCTFERRGNV